MKALVVASSENSARAIIELIRGQFSAVDQMMPAEVTAKSTSGHSVVLLLPLPNSEDLQTFVDACSRLHSAASQASLTLALAHDCKQLDALVDAGADDFMLWPADPALLRRRLDICRTRATRRDRDFMRAQLLAETLREAELNEQRFRHLAESSTEILTRCSPGGVRLYVSPACRAILGYEPDELLGAHMFDILHPGDKSALVEAIEMLEEGADVAITVVRLQRKDGQYAWLETICRPVRDPKSNAIEEIVTVARDITTLVHIEHDKLEAEGQFEAFASRAPVGIFKVELNGNCVFINPRACELLGTTAEDAAGHGWMKLADVQDIAALAANSLQKGSDEKGYSWDMAIRHPNGEKSWLAIKATATRNRSGQTTGYVATLIDVTRERQAQQELQASEQRFRSIVEDISDLVCRYLPDGTLTYVNEAYCRTFNASVDALIGKSFLPFLPPEDRAVFDTVLATVSPQKPLATSVHRAIWPNGEVRWHEWYDRGIFDEDGRLVELLGTGRDITERRKLEQDLADAGAFLRDVLDAVPDPISVEDEAGNFVMVNRSFFELVSRCREDIVGQPVGSIRPRPHDGNASWQTASDEREITMPSADGTLRSLSEKRAVLGVHQGRRVIVSVMRDVTERKRYEAQLALTERLASLGTLAAGIAHEINNPLSYVIGNLGFAADSMSNANLSGPQELQLPELRNALNEALEGARRIAGIVRDVKMFSRADRETLRLIEPTRVVEASLRMVQGNLESRSRIVREIAPDTPRILGNEARLAQVIVNLLMNAVQSLPDRPTSENQIVVAIRPEQKSVVMEVRDNGEGIAPDKLRHVFDPFFTTKAVGEGMGLGLSICNSIVTAHGGRIDVDSTVGVGSAFRVILPAAPTPIRKPKSP